MEKVAWGWKQLFPHFVSPLKGSAKLYLTSLLLLWRRKQRLRAPTLWLCSNRNFDPPTRGFKNPNTWLVRYGGCMVSGRIFQVVQCSYFIVQSLFTMTQQTVTSWPLKSRTDHEAGYKHGHDKATILRVYIWFPETKRLHWLNYKQQQLHVITMTPWTVLEETDDFLLLSTRILWWVVAQTLLFSH